MDWGVPPSRYLGADGTARSILVKTCHPVSLLNRTTKPETPSSHPTTAFARVLDPSDPAPGSTVLGTTVPSSGASMSGATFLLPYMSIPRYFARMAMICRPYRNSALEYTHQARTKRRGVALSTQSGPWTWIYWNAAPEGPGAVETSHRVHGVFAMVVRPTFSTTLESEPEARIVAACMLEQDPTG